MSREDARNLWISAQLDHSHLTLGRLQMLRTMINDEMKASGLIKGSYRVQGHFKAGIAAKGWWADLRCKSFYFQKRQAVTFEDSGFIGFAGWSDDDNVRPILSAFSKWVEWMQKECFRNDD